MPNLAYLELKELAGLSKIKGREKMHEVTAFKHKIAREIDPHNGEPNKVKVHSELVIQKHIDARSHWFHHLHDQRKKIRWCGLHLYHMPPAGGTEVKYLTYELYGARIVQIEMLQPQTYIKKNHVIKEYEQISFIYDKLIIKEAGNITATHEVSTSLLSGEDAVFHVDWVEENAKGLALQALGELGKWVGLKLKKTASGAKINEIISKIGFIKLYEAMYQKTGLPNIPIDTE